jgi:anaerobic selenocysteine-containing dehydrogenase
VGCNLELHVQDNEIVKVTSPFDHDVTRGNLCIKGRFGWRLRAEPSPRAQGDGRGSAKAVGPCTCRD